MEQSNIYKLLALTAIISILISVGAFTLMKDSFIGPRGLQGEAGESIVGPIGPQGEAGESIVGPQGVQGPQGEQGEPFPYEGEWVLTHDWYWSDTILDEWTYTFTTEAEFIILQPVFIYDGDYPEYAFMSLRVYEGRYATGETILYWSSSWDYGGTSLMLLGKGTYTIEANTIDFTDVWIDIWEFILN